MLIDEFISYISSVRRYSDRTVDIYRSVLEEYCSYSIEGNRGEDIIKSLNNTAIRNYEVYLLDTRKESSKTVNLHLSVLSSFCRFLMKKGMLEANPVRLVARPKTEKRLPVFYREESMEEYFESTGYLEDEENIDIVSYDSILNHLILSILFNTGIRRSELINLTLNSFDGKRKVLVVKGKGDKMREIPLTENICHEICLYLQKVTSELKCTQGPDSPLLLTRKGEKLYPVFVDRAIKSELGGVGSITGRKSPHVLRHTLATELLNNGADLNSIKELLGHSSLAATQVYTHNSIEKLRKVYKQAHPRAKSEGNYGDKD